jgi:hypothetical protein
MPALLSGLCSLALRTACRFRDRPSGLRHSGIRHCTVLRDNLRHTGFRRSEINRPVFSSAARLQRPLNGLRAVL